MKAKIIDHNTQTFLKEFDLLKEVELHYTNVSGIISWNNVVLETTKANSVPMTGMIYNVELIDKLSATLTGEIISATYFGKNDGTIYMNLEFKIHSVSNVRIVGDNLQLNVAEAYDRAMAIIK